jgi:hypothetical protein
MICGSTDIKRFPPDKKTAIEKQRLRICRTLFVELLMISQPKDHPVDASRLSFLFHGLPARFFETFVNVHFPPSLLRDDLLSLSQDMEAMRQQRRFHQQMWEKMGLFGRVRPRRLLIERNKPLPIIRSLKDPRTFLRMDNDGCQLSHRSSAP